MPRKWTILAVVVFLLICTSANMRAAENPTLLDLVPEEAFLVIATILVAGLL